MEYVQKGNLLIYPNHQRIILSGEVGKGEQINLSTALVHFQGKETQLFIDSPGGLFSSGVHIFDAIRLHGQVTGIVMAKASSVAFTIFQACSNRLIYPNAEIMTHAPTIPPIRADQENVLEKAQKSLNQHYDFLIFLSKKLGIALKIIKQWSKEERIFFSEEALGLKLVDKIIDEMPILQ